MGTSEPLLSNLTEEKRKALILYGLHLNTVTAVALEMLLPEKKPRRKRRVWSWPYLQRRTQHGHYDNLMSELYTESPELYRNFTRMDRDMFNEIVQAVTPIIEKKHTYWRKPRQRRLA